jgi:hypothetical protein
LSYEPLTEAELIELDKSTPTQYYFDSPMSLPNKSGPLSSEERELFNLFIRHYPNDTGFKWFPFRPKNVLKLRVPKKKVKSEPFTEEENEKLLELVEQSKQQLKKFQNSLLIDYPKLAKEIMADIKPDALSSIPPKEDKEFDVINWKFVSKHFPERSLIKLKQVYYQLINQNIKKNVKFTQEEDQKILKLKAKGLGWTEMQVHFPGRLSGQLRTRYIILVNSVRGEWTKEELDLLLEGVKLYGFSWIKVSNHVKTRHFLQCMHKYIPNRFPDEYSQRPRNFNSDEITLLHALSNRLLNKISLLTVLFPGHTLHQVRYWHEFHFSGISQKRSWTQEEKEMLLDLFIEYGMEWDKIVENLPFPTSSKDVKIKMHSLVRNIRVSSDEFHLVNAAVLEKFDSEKASGKDFILPRKNWYVDHLDF